MALVVKLLTRPRKRSMNKKVSGHVTPGTVLDMIWLCVLVALMKESETKSESTNPTAEDAEKEAVERPEMCLGRKARRTKERNTRYMKYQVTAKWTKIKPGRSARAPHLVTKLIGKNGDEDKNPKETSSEKCV